MFHSRSIQLAVCAGLTFLLLTAASAFGEVIWPFPSQKYPGDLNYCKELNAAMEEELIHEQGVPLQKQVMSSADKSTLNNDRNFRNTAFINSIASVDYDFWKTDK